MGLTLVRHPEPVGGAGRCYGRTDLHVDAGVVESDAGHLLARLSVPRAPAVHRVVSSPLRRARALADRLAAGLAVPLVEDERFTELDFGSWEGLPWDEVPRDGLECWAADLLGYRGHGGESADALTARVSAGLTSCRPGDLVVCHLGVIRAALSVTGHPDPWSAAVPFGAMLRLPDVADR